MTRSMRNRFGMAAALALCLAGSAALPVPPSFGSSKWPTLEVTPCYSSTLGSAWFVVKMCDGNFFKMELADATLTKAHDAVVLRYSITFGKRGGQLLPDQTDPSQLITFEETAPLGEDASYRGAFGEEFTFRLGDSQGDNLVGLALETGCRAAATVVRTKEGYTLSFPVSISKLRTRQWNMPEKGPLASLMWTPPAILSATCREKIRGDAGTMWAGYKFYLHLPLCEDQLWDLRKELETPEKSASPPPPPASETPEKAP